MIEHLAIRNFRCLREVEVPLSPLTILIGANDTGKSVFLTAIERACHAVDSFTQKDHWRFEGSANPIIRVVVQGKPFSVPRQRNGAYDVGPEKGFPFDKLQPVQRFQLPAAGVAMESPGLSDTERFHLGPDGGFVAAVLDRLIRQWRKHPERLQQLVQTLRDLVPGLEDIDVKNPTRDLRKVVLQIDGGLEIPAEECSAGLRMLLFFVTLAHLPDPPRVVLIEEPETGIHPRRLGDVMKLLRGVTQGRYGDHRAQVILTTHSPYLLDHVDIEQDQVLVFERQPDGSRTAQPVDSERLSVFLDEFMLGEVWYNETETGLVAKP